MAVGLLNNDFLLTSKVAQDLFHRFAKQMPIVDYHCHLDPKEIYENNLPANITELWISSGSPEAPIGDHYKWRLMRAAGFDEKFITGDSTAKEKFLAFAKTLETAMGNPIFEWSHLELRRYFGINKVLNSETAEKMWDQLNKMLAKDDYRPRNLIVNSNVQVVVTTDDPIDDLHYHELLESEEDRFTVRPAWRPDRLMNVFKLDFVEYVDKLAKAAQMNINSIQDLEKAVKKRMDHFAAHGCVLADHGLEVFYFDNVDQAGADAIFRKRIAGNDLDGVEVAKYHTYIQKFMAKEYAARGWVMQMHINALRDLNSPAFMRQGPNTGHDALTDLPIAEAVRQFFDTLELEGYETRTNAVPRTMLYSLNLNDFLVLATIGGTHLQDLGGKGVKQKFQLGPAWWFNDTYSGMYRQLQIFAEESLLGNFTGMLTDSRSFLSYTRHEYFRRILCQFVGDLVERGQLPDDKKMLGKLVQDISYNNAVDYFGFNR